MDETKLEYKIKLKHLSFNISKENSFVFYLFALDFDIL
jgi:hypothetical protein